MEALKLSSRFNIRRATAAGILAAALLALAGAAVLTGNNLLFLVLAATLAALMAAGLVGRLSLAALELDVRLPENVSARRAFPARIWVRNAKRWMPSFSVKLAGIGASVFSTPLYFPLLAGGASASETVDILFARRGIHREDGFQFSTTFPFGLRERTARVSMRREILVYPCMDAQPGFEEFLTLVGGEVTAHYRGLGHDFYRLRPYEAFENVRHVDWKATAHAASLQVREFAREQEPLVEILLDLDAPPAEREWFERAVECCAFLAWRLSQREARVRFATQEFAATAPSTGDIYAILKYLALVTPRPGAPLDPPAEEGSFQLVFTAAPQRYSAPGWAAARFAGLEVLPPGSLTLRGPGW